jgi:hypothetical protein
VLRNTYTFALLLTLHSGIVVLFIICVCVGLFRSHSSVLATARSRVYSLTLVPPASRHNQPVAAPCRRRRRRAAQADEVRRSAVSADKRPRLRARAADE